MGDETFDLDLDKLTLRELDEIETRTGLGIDQLFADGQPRGKALWAVGYVVKKRENPDFTWEEAGDLTIELGEVKKQDPPEAAG